MPKLTGKLVKNLAMDWGASLVGIAPVERFEGAPAGHGPLDLMPYAKSVIVAGVRIPDPVVEYDEYHLKMTEMNEAGTGHQGEHGELLHADGALRGRHDAQHHRHQTG